MFATLEILPISGLALIATTAVIAFGCLDADEAYGAIRWQLDHADLRLPAPGRAMEFERAAQLVVDGVIGLVDELGPVVILSMVYLLTMILPNSPATMPRPSSSTPIAIGLAGGLGVDPLAVRGGGDAGP